MNFRDTLSPCEKMALKPLGRPSNVASDQRSVSKESKISPVPTELKQ